MDGLFHGKSEAQNGWFGVPLLKPPRSKPGDTVVTKQFCWSCFFHVYVHYSWHSGPFTGPNGYVVRPKIRLSPISVKMGYINIDMCVCVSVYMHTPILVGSFLPHPKYMPVISTNHPFRMVEQPRNEPSTNSINLNFPDIKSRKYINICSYMHICIHIYI